MYQPTKHPLQTTLIALGIFIVAVIPRIWQLDYFTMVDEKLWHERSAYFLQGLLTGDLAQTAQTGHPGVTTMWSGTLGLVVYYLQSAAPDESLTQFATRMTHTQATLHSLRLLRLPLALLSAFTVALAFMLARQLWGQNIALIAASLMAFEPTYLAHARALHHDAPTANFALVAILAWLLYLNSTPNRTTNNKSTKSVSENGYLLGAGVAIALAMLSKISALFLLGFAGLSLLPHLWTHRQTPWLALQTVAIPWLKLTGITFLTMIVIWPALWATPGHVWQTLFDFISRESSTHARGTFFMGQAVTNPGLLFYPLGLAFELTPLTLIGSLLSIIGLVAGIAHHTKNAASPSLPANLKNTLWLLIYAILFVLFMSFIGKKQQRYVLPAVVALNVLAGWGLVWLKNHLPAKWGAVIIALLIGGQMTFALSHAPYYATFFNPLLGGGNQAQTLLLIGRGEGLEQAATYILDEAKNKNHPLRVSSWYASTIAILFQDKVTLKDNVHLHYILESDYTLFYINQKQRQLPNQATLDYVQHNFPLLKTIQLAGLDYVNIYQGKAISHPVDPFAPQNLLVGKANLAGFDLKQAPAAGEPISLHLYWINAGRQPSEHFYARLTDKQEQDWAWGTCSPLDSFGEASSWQKDQIIESTCQLVLHPGSPPLEYYLRVGLIAEDGTVIGQMNLNSEEGGVTASRPPIFPSNEWIPAEHKINSPLNDSISLIGYDYTLATRKPGEMMPLTFYWRAQQVPQENYTFRLRLQGENAEHIAQWEQNPSSHSFEGGYPTSQWQPNEVIRDPWQVPLAKSLPNGIYTLTLSLIDENGLENTPLPLTQQTIAGRDRLFTLAQSPLIPQQAQLGDSIYFIGYDLGVATGNGTLQAGQPLDVTLTWQAQKTPAHNYNVFVQLLDSAGQVRAQHDGQPGQGTLETTSWATGEYIQDTHQLPLPADLPSGEYRLIIGLYLPATGERLPVFDEKGTLIGDHLILRSLLSVP